MRHLELPGREDLRKLQLLREEQGELSAGDESRLRRLQRVRCVWGLELIWMRHARPWWCATLSLMPAIRHTAQQARSEQTATLRCAVLQATALQGTSAAGGLACLRHVLCELNTSASTYCC